jgi:pimeloyl-ACP methyl ester carboxylesterase
MWGSLFVDERAWGGMIESLAGDRQVIVINGPGHGNSQDPSRRYTQDECATAAQQVLAAFHIVDPVDWIENAWGGAVGMILAVRGGRQVVRSLVMLGTPIDVYSSRERRRTQLLLALHAVLGMHPPLPKIVASVLLARHTMQHNPQAVDVVCSALRRSDRRMLRNAIRSISLGRPDLSPILHRVDIQALIVTGREHPGFTPEQASRAAAQMSTATVSVVDGCAYLLPLEAPEETTALVRQFWSSDVLAAN